MESFCVAIAAPVADRGSRAGNPWGGGSDRMQLSNANNLSNISVCVSHPLPTGRASTTATHFLRHYPPTRQADDFISMRYPCDLSLTQAW
jgi:hypothetical protein